MPKDVPLEDTAELPAYSHPADEPLDKATKEQVADVARLLALNIGYYHEKYGDVPQEALVGMAEAETLDQGGKAPADALSVTPMP